MYFLANIRTGAFMPIINRIAEFHKDMSAWRQDIHAHPETAFEEHRTSAIVADKLESFGVEVHKGLAGTGIVGTLSTGDGPTIGLRADMDALHIDELNDFDHKSTHDGKMHACGHDGHTTMLLGAARYLAETKRFKGTVRFIFQPAEENEGGGRKMVEDGLFEKLPVDKVFGMHNWPGMPLGAMAMTAGPQMAAVDRFTITVKGQGFHGAMPNLGVDAVLTAAEIVLALQSICARKTDPLDAAVLSVAQFHAGDTANVVPDQAVLNGTTRVLRPEVHDTIEASVRRICEGIASAHGAEVDVDYRKGYPATINTEAETELAARAANAVVGADKVDRNPNPSLGAEDFSYMLQERPGCYAWIGNGPGEGGCILHNARYDFNDEILPIGASYWATLTEQVLSAD
jgi:hippurate hydrolase